MALAIATNNAALNAAASASSVNREMEQSMARLSSGKRINSASDDAAGVAISSRLSAEIRGTDQAIRNALDGQALIDTAEGAHSEIENILQRMREVSVQAANDTNNDQDRANLQAEMNALVTEIDRIAGTTTWAGEKLMEAEAGTDFSFQVGAKTGAKNQISITINGMGAHALGLQADPADVQKTLNNVAVGQSNNTVTHSSPLPIHQGNISSGVVSPNNGNTSITLQKLGSTAIINTPAVSTTSTANDTVTLNAKALADGFTLTLGAGPINAVAAANGSAQDLVDTINLGTGNILASGAITSDAGHGYSATLSGNVITLAAAGAITHTSGVTTAATTDVTPSGAGTGTVTMNATALAEGFTLTLETGKTVDAVAGGTTQDLADAINLGTGNILASGATASDEGHGYSASVSGDVITLTAAGAITHASGVTTAAGSGVVTGVALSTVTVSAGTLSGVSSSAVTTTYSYDDVTYSTDSPSSINAAAAAINAATAQTNITATIGADGTNDAGKIILAHNGVAAAGIGQHGSLSSVHTAYDTANSDPAATLAVNGQEGILSFHENAGTNFELVLGNINATGATSTDLAFTIDTTVDLQLAVNAINDGSGSAGSGVGIAAHGYTASIVAGADGSPVNGTIKLTSSSAANTNTQVSFSSIDLGAVGQTTQTVTSSDGSFDASTGVFTPGTVNTTGTVSLTLGGTAVTVPGISASGASPADDAAAIVSTINAGSHGYTAVAMTGSDVGKVQITQPAAITQDMDVNTASAARESIVAIDEAIQTVNIQRSKLGAVSNRLSHTINNLTNISSNLSAAQGGIEDADFAHETTMLAKNQILQQASTAMLAQANASKQNVLSLLQG